MRIVNDEPSKIDITSKIHIKGAAANACMTNKREKI